ncbi:recombinase family protein [Sinorhizobium sp. BG8]|uniref:recombinase family protein n=1 Tax=Sinorhizobium sp. BG8 TaxID=2613773 RepID=UPI00193CD363|nr:recombinase family protein [Sinorhizobium sp. BG8]QRM55109.1 recombinase family protein [Sinorhizobium sp. BG8]
MVAHDEMKTRAVAYLRNACADDLKLVDQRAQIEQFCAARGWQFIAEYADSGCSGTDGKRPQFQRMIARAVDIDHSFDVVVVTTNSRFFRGMRGLNRYVQVLECAEVRLVSISEGVAGAQDRTTMRRLMGKFGEYLSRQDSLYIRAALAMLPRGGYSTGSRRPYSTATAVLPYGRTRQRLVADLLEAKNVKLVFQLFLSGDGATGPLGTKEIAKRLKLPMRRRL